MVAPTPTVLPTTVHVLTGRSLQDRLRDLTEFTLAAPARALSRHPAWVNVFRDGLGHTPLVIETRRGARTTGILPLMFVRSTLFGRFLVSLPYLSTAGVVAESPRTSERLVESAIDLARQLRVRYLELRHEAPIEHPALNATYSSKVHLRLALPDFPGPLWESFKPSVRNLVRKGEKYKLTVHWGARDLLDEFHHVLAVNMRDLGTPVYGRKFFRAILKQFPAHAEVCVVRYEGRPVAGGLLLHGKGVTEIPSASSLREFKHTSANMLMYWKILERCIERGQNVFDFGRSTIDSGTYQFKKQWGAEAHPTCWQYHLRFGSAVAMRSENPKYQQLIALWQRMPVWLTRAIGPTIVRGIP
jgi:serine/alanine adding enzyme